MLACCTLTLAIAASFALAQNATPSVSLEMSPTNPAPLTNVDISVSSYAIDVNQANITWSYNDKVVATGMGRKTVTITAPNSGLTATIRVTVESPGNDPITESISINPASVDVLWEAIDSYTPPFYKGKAKAATSASIKAVAIPAYNAPKQLSYQWTHNDSAEDAVSGFNKSSILFQNSYTDKTESVGVTVSGGLFNGSGNTSLAIGDPSLVGYESVAGFIDYNNGGTSSFITYNPGTTLHVEPFFFSIKNSIAKDLSIAFTDQQGNPVSADTTPNELTLAKPSSGPDANLTIAITTKTYTLQSVKRDFSVTFSQ